MRQLTLQRHRPYHKQVPVVHACRETQRVCVADDSFTSVMGDGFTVRDTQTVMGDAYSYVFLPLSAGATLAGYALAPLWLTP